MTLAITLLLLNDWLRLEEALGYLINTRQMWYPTSKSTNHCCSLLHFSWLQHFYRDSGEASQLKKSLCVAVCVCLSGGTCVLNKPISPILQGRNKAAVDVWMDGCIDAWMGEQKRIRTGKKDEMGHYSNCDPKPHSPVQQRAHWIHCLIRLLKRQPQGILSQSETEIDLSMVHDL